MDFLRDAGATITCGEVTAVIRRKRKTEEEEEQGHDIVDTRAGSTTQPETTTVRTINRNHPTGLGGTTRLPAVGKPNRTGDAELADRSKHAQRRFKLSKGAGMACWEKVGRSGDVRICTWFSTERT
ncbi:GL24580 [Drosophila persimilis]|uniref:GL24580 n=1 Tax=Drosophila persimilis TaxID=7234 RepID=B4H622_DROPE|nr:GL24580 [Drosophila persimilis]